MRHLRRQVMGMVEVRWGKMTLPRFKGQRDEAQPEFRNMLAPQKRLSTRSGVRLTGRPAVNVKNLEYSPDNSLLQALEAAPPNRIASLVQLANNQDTPIADSTTEALFLWLKESDWVRGYRQKYGLSTLWPASTL